MTVILLGGEDFNCSCLLSHKDSMALVQRKAVEFGVEEKEGYEAFLKSIIHSSDGALQAESAFNL